MRQTCENYKAFMESLDFILSIPVKSENVIVTKWYELRKILLLSSNCPCPTRYNITLDKSCKQVSTYSFEENARKICNISSLT